MAELLARETKEELAEQFTMHFDAAAGLVKLMDFMKTENTSLREMADMLPEIHMAGRKGMRLDAKESIRKDNTGALRGRMEMLEGVKVYNDKGCGVILPDAERPVCTRRGFLQKSSRRNSPTYARKHE